jgi:hypothetical protein
MARHGRVGVTVDNVDIRKVSGAITAEKTSTHVKGAARTGAAAEAAITRRATLNPCIVDSNND